jgi:hypothetical protein
MGPGNTQGLNGLNDGLFLRFDFFWFLLWARRVNPHRAADWSNELF